LLFCHQRILILLSLPRSSDHSPLNLPTSPVRVRLIDPALSKALALSLLLHALLFAAGEWLGDSLPRTARALESRLDVELQPRDVPSEALPLRLPEESPPPSVRPLRKVPARAAAAGTSRRTSAAESGMVLAGEAARQANAQLARELLYPAEAIARGLEGEALVLLFLDARGNAVAARLEASSGHALLDDAAVRAARTLRGLPASAPREALLPVRFRLR
jgi:protein TonB